MKILYFNPEDNTFMGQWQSFQIYNELEHYDIHIIVLNPWTYSSYAEANENLLKRLKEDKSIDMFMSCVSTEILFEETMKEIRNLPIPKLLICYDNLHAPYMHKYIAPYFDLVWLTSWETEPMFKKWGCNTIFQPYASNPFTFKDMYEGNINKVCFVGTPYGTRTMMFNTLVQGGIDVDVYCKSKESTLFFDKSQEGKSEEKSNIITTVTNCLSFSIGRKVLYSKIKSGIMRTPQLLDSKHLRLLEKLSNEDMNKAYSNYSLSLNVIALRNTAVLKTPVHKLHLRTFEIPMCGGLELVEFNEELADYFSDKEMVFYKNKEEMIDKARFYTDTKNERFVREMKIRARQRAVNEHCWMRRFSKVFDYLGLVYKTAPTN